MELGTGWRRYPNMPRALILQRLVLPILLSTFTPAAVSAGTFPYVGVSFGTPQRPAAQVGVAFGRNVPRGGAEFEMGAGSIIEASIGRGAGQMSVGRSFLLLTDKNPVRLLADMRATISRTWDSPRGGSPHATYAGVEGGLSLSVVRLTLGVAKRLESRLFGANVLVTWGAGVQFRMGKRPN